MVVVTLGPYGDGLRAEGCGGWGAAIISTWTGRELLFGAERRFVLGMVTILSKLEIKTYGLIMGRTLETGTVLQNLVQYNVEK